MSDSKDTQKTVDKEKNAIKWTTDNIQTFLETFQNYELLWNVRHKDYPNKAKRESNILKLKEDLVSRSVAVPDVAFLRARIKTIKTTYRSEVMKVLSSKTRGSGADDVYTPKLPWFQKADSFLNSLVVTRESQSNLVSKTPPNKAKPEERPKTPIPAPEPIKPEESRTETLKRKSDNESEYFGQLVAAKHSQLTQQQRMYAETLICLILNKGILQQLSDRSAVVEQPEVYHSDPSNFMCSSSSFNGDTKPDDNL